MSDISSTKESRICLVMVFVNSFLVLFSTCSVIRYATPSMGFVVTGGSLAKFSATDVNRVLARVSKVTSSPANIQPLVKRWVLCREMDIAVY